MILYSVLRPLPLSNKVVVRSFEGKKYGDNPQYIIENLLNKGIDVVWLKDEKYEYEVPKGVRIVKDKGLKKFYEYYTAKVWIDTHRINKYLIKREEQLYIETWHGGLGIKKIDGDVPKFRKIKKLMTEVNHMCNIADLFISNSKHLTNVYRTAFGYKGKIWKCGYPKNDILVRGSKTAELNVRNYFKIPQNTKILVYAPTFRDRFRFNGFDANLYDIDFDAVFKTLKEKTGYNWCILQKHHPFLIKRKEANIIDCKHVINANFYSDMQEIILSADAFISDYSSCIFDAAIREIPCFIYAKDFDEYSCDRGVYYTLDELPFSYAANNNELIIKLNNFNYREYKRRLFEFKMKTGLYEPGDSSIKIANLILSCLYNGKSALNKIISD